MTGKVDARAVVGVGLGPANLSLLALVAGSSGCAELLHDCVVLETRDSFDWHPGQLFPDARMQNSFVRDLVVLADPTNRLSFLNYLKRHGRLLQALNAGLYFPFRADFVRYMAEVAEELAPMIRFAETVVRVSIRDDKSFLVLSNDEHGREVETVANNVLLGPGFEPSLPEGVTPSDRAFHVSEFLSRDRNVAGLSIAVVGGAQSAAELIEELLARQPPPRAVTWMTSRPNFDVLDTGNFAREIYTPGYASFFHGLASSERERLLRRDRAAESGISPSTAESVAQTLYRTRFLDHQPPDVRLLANARVTGCRGTDSGEVLTVQRATDGAVSEQIFDSVVFCTGFRDRPLADFGEIFGGQDPPRLRNDYSLDLGVQRDGSNVYVQSLGRVSFGVSDANFTMICHRNATILNSILSREAFAVDHSDTFVEWSTLA